MKKKPWQLKSPLLKAERAKNRKATQRTPIPTLARASTYPAVVPHMRDVCAVCGMTWGLHGAHDAQCPSKEKIGGEYVAAGTFWQSGEETPSEGVPK